MGHKTKIGKHVGRTPNTIRLLILFGMILCCNIFTASAKYCHTKTCDTIPPVIKLVGDSIVYVEVFHTYTDSGATATDNYYSSKLLNLFVNSNVNTSSIGTYLVTYDATDPEGNRAKTVTRYVVVEDTIPPVITLKGPGGVSTCQYAKNYVDSGYTISDNYDKFSGIIVVEEGSFIMKIDSFTGIYTFRYKAVDGAGNFSYSAYRYILVKPANDLSCGSSIPTAFDTTICKNSCADITVPYTGTSYKWSTSDTTKTIHFCPTHDSLITVTVTTSAGTISCIYYIHVTQYTCVWPGDADNDMTADKNDLLAIGIAYGDSGTKRASASTDWTGQPCADWKKTFKSGEDFKNADCNGDGLVDSTDMAAITKNYGKTHYKSSAANGSITDPPLYSKFSRDSAQAGDTVAVTLSLGSSAIPANKVYGVKFSINYTAQYMKLSHTLPDFSKCWVGTPGKDMLYLVHNDSINGKLDIAITRIDHKSVSGYGTIGVLGMVMQDNLGGKRWIDRTVYFNIGDVKMITEKEDVLPVYTQPDSVRAYKDRSGISSSQLSASVINLYPNPASDRLTIDGGNEMITGVKILDITGNEVYAIKTANASKLNIPVSTLCPGIYAVIINTKKGNIIKHFTK